MKRFYTGALTASFVRQDASGVDIDNYHYNAMCWANSLLEAIGWGHQEIRKKHPGAKDYAVILTHTIPENAIDLTALPDPTPPAPLPPLPATPA